MSRPRVRRTVYGSRAASSTALNAAIVSRDEPVYIPVGVDEGRHDPRPSPDIQRTLTDNGTVSSSR